MISVLRTALLASFAVSASLLILGCGADEPQLVPFRGQLLYNGQPLAGAELAFQPQFQGPGWIPVAVAGDDGSFTVGTKDDGDGALPGPYKVSVIWRPSTGENGEDPNLLPGHYARPESSGLEVQVSPGSEETPVIRLTGPPIRRRKP